MYTIILKSLLNRAFYEEHKNQLHEKLFDGDARAIFKTIKSLHQNSEEYGADEYSPTELRLIYDNLNPLSTPAQKSVVHDFIASIGNAEDIHAGVASELIEGLYTRAECTVLANLAIEASEGVEGAWDRILQLVEKNKDSFIPEEVVRERQRLWKIVGAVFFLVMISTHWLRE